MPIDSLVIIGNGFDSWQGLRTSYFAFRDYYLAHRDGILRKLGIRKKVIRCGSGPDIVLSDVELIYGDPFAPGELADNFWGFFESALDKIDGDRLNLFFGKDKAGLREMRKSIRDAKRILTRAFCDWIASIPVDARDAGFRFGSNCLFINFNYTDTLQKRFYVKPYRELHIHGEASDPKSVVFGHSTHPQLPETMLHDFGGRFRGLYYVDQVLYETDKHVLENIDYLCAFLALHGASPQGIRNIYVLGHSMSPVDLEYFCFLADATRCGPPKFRAEDADTVGDPLEDLDLRLKYTIARTGGSISDEDADPETVQAIWRQSTREQEQRSERFLDDFGKMLKRAAKMNGTSNATVPPSTPRATDAQWHISCFRKEDRIYAEAVMKELDCPNYRLYDTIDEALLPFKIQK